VDNSLIARPLVLPHRSILLSYFQFVLYLVIF
jgi:hypothetical protein